MSVAAILADLATAVERTRATLRTLAARGERLETLSVNAAQLDADTDAFRTTSLGVLDQSCAARYCRAFFLDIDFRRLVCASLFAALLFCASVLTHWYLLT